MTVDDDAATTNEEIFDQIADQIATERSDVSRNRRGSLVKLSQRQSVRAMTSRGAIVVRLDRQRVADLVASGHGIHYKGQINEWLQLGDELDVQPIHALVEEAVDR